ncbi:hypothetical protein G7Y29_02150 [Corynebacterium qintianiae]|uniref:PE domain-containing protein n=1 Tax=Corynebacterium qintianiae TaxID=2709392 RepID=A0A7T0KNN8_9CORY|nr:hypothetical protein [Corynebacterium qintianiae]QPK83634.1 hypothetical protein G7Y29_02150 [Corynebacterium qintianiae]
MKSFIVDAPAVADLTATLREAAAGIGEIPSVPAPGPGATADFAAALAHAIERANERGWLLREEASRIADVMDLTVDAARAVDDALARELGVTLP